MSDEPRQTRYRRWPRLVGGDNDDQPVPGAGWSSGIVHAQKNIAFNRALLWSSDPNAEIAKIEIESYTLRRITVGQTRLILKVFVEQGLSEAQAMEMIWDRLLEQVGS